MKKNRKALSLFIAISITLVMSLLALYIFEYIIPFSKNTKNIEQSVVAYYQADSAIEDVLLNNLENTLDSSKMRDYSISIIGSGKVLPPAGNGNSEFDKDYNIIKVGEPIQLEIGKGQDKLYSDMNFKFYFKVPNLDGKKSTIEELNNTSSGFINWQLSGENNTLNASGSLINKNEICNSNVSCSVITLENREGRNLNDNSKTFKTFYNHNCKGSGSGCILKMSVINTLKLTDGTSIPYLEWKINTDEPIQLRYKIIDTTGKSYGFQKSLRVKVPQQTLNEAFDFTVFQ